MVNKQNKIKMTIILTPSKWTDVNVSDKAVDFNIGEHIDCSEHLKRGYGL